MPRLSDALVSGNGAAADALAEALFARLADRGKIMVDGEGVEFYDGTKIMVPHGFTYSQARKVIDRAEKEAETRTRWDREYPYRFNDGAYALMTVLKRRYGGAFGETVYTMFGPQPPELRTIDIAYGVTAQVPYGELSLPALDGLEIHSLEWRDREYGQIFRIVAQGPRKYAKEVEALFAEVDEHLRTRSIYRGKAVAGTDKLEFLDLDRFRESEIVFSSKAHALLDTNVWQPLRHAADLKAEGVPLKRAALLHGPYGTGKTSAGLVTAKVAVSAGWTALTARAGQDDIVRTLQTARLYQPAVVFLEDVDGEASSGDPEDVTKLLEVFDGVTAKGSEIVLVATTNHLDRIHKALLRPGRFDAVIEIGSLDAAGIERLIKAVVSPDKLFAEVDYTAVAKAMNGFYPAFVREAVDRARVVAITRQGRSYALDTAALVAAADTLQEQLRALEKATEGERTPTLDKVFNDAVQGAVSGLVVAPGNHDWEIGQPEDED